MTWPDDVPVLTDGRVTLRAHRRDDLQGVYEQCTDPETPRWTTVPVPYSRDDAAEFIAGRRDAWESGRRWPFAIETDGGSGPSRFGGSISVGSEQGGVGEIAFGAHPAVRGKGVTTAAVRLISDWAFGVAGLRVIVWQATEGNAASLRVAWKTGFTIEGATRAMPTQRGEPRQGWRGTLLESDSREPKSRWLEPVVLEDDRVRLRKLGYDDQQRFLKTTNDPQTRHWLGNIGFPRDAGAFLRHHHTRELGSATGSSIEWVIADPQDDRYLGTVNVFGFRSLDYKSAEVGYRTHPEVRGRGVLKAGLRLALAYAFTSDRDGGLGLERVSLGAADANLASQGVARACGFTETGRDRRCYDLPDGRVVDLIRFDLLRSEFRSP